MGTPAEDRPGDARERRADRRVPPRRTAGLNRYRPSIHIPQASRLVRFADRHERHLPATPDHLAANEPMRAGIFGINAERSLRIRTRLRAVVGSRAVTSSESHAPRAAEAPMRRPIIGFDRDSPGNLPAAVVVGEPRIRQGTGGYRRRGFDVGSAPPSLHAGIPAECADEWKSRLPLTSTRRGSSAATRVRACAGGRQPCWEWRRHEATSGTDRRAGTRSADCRRCKRAGRKRRMTAGCVPPECRTRGIARAGTARRRRGHRPGSDLPTVSPQSGRSGPLGATDRRSPAASGAGRCARSRCN